jgi:hypothetical protein
MLVRRLDEILGLKETDVYGKELKRIIEENNLTQFEKLFKELEDLELSKEEVYTVNELVYNLEATLEKRLPIPILNYRSKVHDLTIKWLKETIKRYAKDGEGLYPGRTLNFWVEIDGKPVRIVGKLDGVIYIKDKNKIKPYGLEVKTFQSLYSFERQLKRGNIQVHMYAYGSRILDWILLW